MSQLARAGRTLLMPLTGLAGWYNRSAQSHPLLVGVLTTGFKTSAADIFAQKVIERREEFDFTRHAAFCAFGFAYLGGFQYWLYNIKFTQWCGSITKTFGHKASAPIKTFIDQAIHHPLVYFPAFFGIKAVVSGQPLSAAAHKYQTEIWDSLKALWMVWVPAQFINFAFVPRHLRIPYVAAVSFGWTVILSVMQGKFDAAIAQKGHVAGDGSSGASGSSPAAVAEALAAAAAAGSGTGVVAPPAPKAPSLLPAAAAAVVQQEQQAAAAAAATPPAGRASAHITSIVQNAVTEARGSAVEEA